MEKRNVLIFPFSKNESNRLLRMMEKANLDIQIMDKDNHHKVSNSEIQGTEIIFVSAYEFDFNLPESSWNESIKRIQSIPLPDQKQSVVWCDLKSMSAKRSAEQAQRLNTVKQIFPNQHFLTYRSLIKLVDDIRSLPRNRQLSSSNAKYDLTLMAHVADGAIMDKTSIILEGVIHVNCILIDSSDGNDYDSICSNALKVSKMVVVLAASAGEWSINFTRQLWKNNGGSSSTTPLVMLFDKQHFANIPDVKIPGVNLLHADDSMSGLEIKVEFDRFLARKNA